MTRDTDRETRDRLLDEAAHLFAAYGFDNVTIRDICTKASANVAAVNYHFGDKAGLYRAVVTMAIEQMLETNELSQRAGDGLSPEEQIRGFVRVFVGRLTGNGPTAWIHRLMARELEHPTEALDLVMRQVVVPRLEYLSGVVDDRLLDQDRFLLVTRDPSVPFQEWLDGRLGDEGWTWRSLGTFGTIEVFEFTKGPAP